MYVDDYSISGEQVRAARALLRVDQKQIAIAAGVSLETIKRLEAVEGPINATSRTLTALRNAFLNLGVVFDGREDVDLAVGWMRSDFDARRNAPRPRQTKPQRHTSLTRLMFWSPARPEASAAVLSSGGLLRLRKQPKSEVTGAEFQHNGYLMKVLEGPTDVVDAVYDSGLHTAGFNDTTLIQSRRVTGRLFQAWSVLNGETPAVEDIVFNDVGMANGFHPHDMSPAAVIGLFVLLVLSQQG